MKQHICRPEHLIVISRVRTVPDTEKIKDVLNIGLSTDGFEICLCHLIETTIECREEIDFLLACSQINSVIVRDSAVKVLGESAALDAKIDDALGLRLGDSSWIVRCSAMYGLGLRQSKVYTMKIIQRYKSWSFIEKQWVLMSLIKMKDERANSFLTRIFRYSNNRDRKYLAAAGLAVLGVLESKKFLDTQHATAIDQPPFPRPPVRPPALATASTPKAIS